MRRSSPRKPRVDDGWDDEAWASNSDDEEFVTRIATRRTPSAAWTRAMDAHKEESYQHLPQDAPAAPSAPVPAAPVRQVEAPASRSTSGTDRMDAFVSSWAERSMSLVSPDSLPPRPDLDALIDGTCAAALPYPPDPMEALTTYRTELQRMYAAPEPESERTLEPSEASASAPHDDDGDDLGLHASYAAPSAPAFDPLATTGDGIMMTLGSFAPSSAPEPPRPPRPQPVRQASSSSVPASSAELRRRPSSRTLRRYQQFAQCLESDEIDLAALRTLAWKGVPSALRPIVWPMLLGYLPVSAPQRASTLARKRAEYAAGVERALSRGTQSLDQAIWHQIHIDVPRTNPGIRLWQQDATQRALERLLYVWAIRHPASGYVQGINDLATPFFEVFLSAYIDSDPEQYDLAQLPPRALQALEADTFWCLSKLLDGIQDNYIFAQPGIQRQLRRMGEVVARVDGTWPTD